MKKIVLLSILVLSTVTISAFALNLKNTEQSSVNIRSENNQLIANTSTPTIIIKSNSSSKTNSKKINTEPQITTPNQQYNSKGQTMDYPSTCMNYSMTRKEKQKALENWLIQNTKISSYNIEYIVYDYMDWNQVKNDLPPSLYKLWKQGYFYAGGDKNRELAFYNEKAYSSLLQIGDYMKNNGLSSTDVAYLLTPIFEKYDLNKEEISTVYYKVIDIMPNYQDIRSTTKFATDEIVLSGIIKLKNDIDKYNLTEHDYIYKTLCYMDYSSIEELHNPKIFEKYSDLFLKTGNIKYLHSPRDMFCPKALESRAKIIQEMKNNSYANEEIDFAMEQLSKDLRNKDIAPTFYKELRNGALKLNLDGERRYAIFLIENATNEDYLSSVSTLFNKYSDIYPDIEERLNAVRNYIYWKENKIPEKYFSIFYNGDAEYDMRYYDLECIDTIDYMIKIAKKHNTKFDYSYDSDTESKLKLLNEMRKWDNVIDEHLLKIMSNSDRDFRWACSAAADKDIPNSQKMEVALKNYQEEKNEKRKNTAINVILAPILLPLYILDILIGNGGMP